jgi:tetratricopeptide (TPR) repeat protein
MDCVSVCPNDALYFGFGKPSLAVRTAPLRSPSLTWPEETFVGAVFFVSFLAVWDVYQLIPMLMALGIASVTTFLAYRLLKLFRAADSSFYRFNLKSSGTIRAAGWIFAVCALVWIVLNAHSGFVRYHENAGNVAFENIRIPDELALARTNPEPWLGPNDRRFVAEGRRHFNTAVGAGLLTNSFALPKLAWIEYLAGDTERAVVLLGRAAEHQTGQARALSLYYRGVMLNRLGRHAEALEDLDTAIGERPDLITAREERGEALWSLGRREEAVAEVQFAVSQNPNLVLGNYVLAGAYAALGNAVEASAFEAAADRSAPADPYFQWMLGLRLQNVGMNELADKRFRKAIQINPEFRFKRTFEPGR